MLLCAMLDCLVMFMASFNAVCIMLVYFALDFCIVINPNAFCFMLYLWVIDTVYLFPLLS